MVVKLSCFCNFLRYVLHRQLDKLFDLNPKLQDGDTVFSFRECSKPRKEKYKKAKKATAGAQKKGSKKQPLATCSLNYKGGGQNGGKARLFLPAAAWKGRAWVHTEEETSALKLKVP